MPWSADAVDDPVAERVRSLSGSGVRWRVARDVETCPLHCVGTPRISVPLAEPSFRGLSTVRRVPK